MTRASAVIVGGGVMGVSLLYHLVKEGWSDVVLLEKSGLTHGSTWHAAGLCTHFAHSLTVQELRARSVRLYRDILPAETGQDVGFHHCGALRITRRQDRMDEFAHVAGLSRFAGHELRLVTAEEIFELHPLTRTDGLIGGIHEPDDGHVDPTLATNAMADVARRGGGAIRLRERVVAVGRVDGLWRVKTEKGEIVADQVVNAAGTWAWEVGRMMGVEVSSVPILHQYLVVDRVPAVQRNKAVSGSELPIIRDPDESWYVRQERDGLLLGPYERDAQTWSVDGVPKEFGAELLPADLDRVEHIIELATTRIPALAEGGLSSVVNGPITFTPDANPLVGPAPGPGNAWMITGSSMGVMEGGGAGWLLAGWMTHGSPPLDPLHVDPRRFGKWVDREYCVKKAVECFGLQFGVHYPFEERPAGRGQRLSALHDVTAGRGAVFGAANGWERPNWFSTTGDGNVDLTFRRPGWFNAVAEEVDRVNRSAGVIDLSALAKFEVSGREARQFMDALGANAPPAPGRTRLVHALTADGGVQSEFLAACLDAERYRLTSAAAAELIDERLLNRLGREFDVEVRNATDDVSAFGCAGPRSKELLEALTGRDCSGPECRWLSAMEIDVGGTRAVVLFVSYTGESGWEMHVRADQAKKIVLELLRIGRTLGVGCFGAYALNSMRLEKGFRAWGMDLTTERTPDEAGLSRFVDCGNRNFEGKAALLSRRQEPQWAMELLEIEAADADPFYGHAVLCREEPVGIVTSGGFGHRMQKSLALAYLKPGAPKSNLNVDILGRRCPARVLDRPPYDPDNRLVSG